MAADSTKAWLLGLDDGYLETWANRGLLRRGRKLAQGLSHTDCALGKPCRANIEDQQQQLDGPSFDQLSCSCSATKACHHLIAFLLLCQQACQAEGGSTGGRVDDSPPDWLDSDWPKIEKSLGLAHVRRARRLLMQAVEVVLQEQPNGWQAEINDGKIHTVRIPHASGLRAAVCTCNKERCVHRALTVLVARAQAGLSDDSDKDTDALSIEQQTALLSIQNWLSELIAIGTAGLSATIVNQGQALATVARQADLPAVAGAVATLVQLLGDEIAARSFISAADFRLRLAPLWGRVRALSTQPLPQPLLHLGGEHRRHYRLVRELSLVGVAAEIWQNPAGARGLTLHLYSPTDGLWYRQTDVRAAVSTDQWTPKNSYDNGSWGGVTRKKVPGATLVCRHAWCSNDRQLSARDGTRIEIVADLAWPTAVSDYSALVTAYQSQLKSDPLAPIPRLPTLICVCKADPPSFDTATQRWRQTLHSEHGQSLRMELILDNAIASKTRKQLDSASKKGHQPREVFGFLLLNEDQQLILRPVSVRYAGKSSWRHLTL